MIKILFIIKKIFVINSVINR